MKELIEVAKQALEYIKENDINKPHFIKHAEEVIKKAERQNTRKQKTLNAAGGLLHADGDEEVERMIKLIVNNEDEKEQIDYVEGVVVWEKVEYSFTCESFLEYIDYKKEDFETK